MQAGNDAKTSAINQMLAERGSYMQVPTAGLNPSGGAGTDLANKLYNNAYSTAQNNTAAGAANGANTASGIIGGISGLASRAATF